MFDNFIWDGDASEDSIFSWKPIPSKIPLSAMITGKHLNCLQTTHHLPNYSCGFTFSGPITGGPFPPGGDAPRAVSKKYFNSVCPNRTVIDATEVNTEEIRYNKSIGASAIFDKWVEKLNLIDDPCIEITQNSEHVFDIWLVHHLMCRW